MKSNALAGIARVALSVVVLHLLSVVAALAESPDWNYVDGSLIFSDLDGGDFDDEDFNGAEIAASWNFHDWAYLAGSYSYQEEGIGSLFLDLELKILSVGLGGKRSVADATDLYGELRYEYWDFQGGTVRADDSGYRAASGVRSVVWRGLELNAEAGYLDVGDIVDGEGYFGLGAIYTFRIGLGLGASYEKIDDLENLRFTLRYAFR